MKLGSYTTAVVITALLGVPTGVAQQPPDTRRAQAGRAELEASLVEIEAILHSPGYSKRLREAKQRESLMIRERLQEGDIQAGDQIVLYVQGEPNLTDTFTLQPGRVLSLPGIPDIPMQGILRSEAQGYLTTRLSGYIRNPVVRVQAMIRLSFLGMVGRPGFYQLPADMLVSEAIMAAGGPTPQADPNKSVVRRVGDVVVAKEDFPDVLVAGRTLDQLNLRAGDEIVVDEGRSTGTSIGRILGGLGLLTPLIYLILRF